MTARNDPYVNSNFVVEIDGITIAGFSEVCGLESRIDVIEYREGNERGFTSRKLPGQVIYSNVVLKLGITEDRSLLDWHMQWVTRSGPLERKSVRIVLRDESGTERRAWLLHKAWPALYCGPCLNATGNDVAIETFELVHEGIEIQ